MSRSGTSQHDEPQRQRALIEASLVRAVEPTDELVLPLRRSVVVQYQTAASGAVELWLYYGDRTISFDEPALFPFGEALAQQSRFVAHVATTWGNGYPWERVGVLLEQLVEAGVLHLADWREPVELTGGPCPAPLPPGPARTARTWDECPALTEDLVGRALDPGHLELVIPVFRVAHPALDADGRQVGESNVFPKALRLDTPTRWRTCVYPGTRYQPDRPMNVTALKAMRAHWPEVMTALAVLRERYLERFPQARAGWTVGDLERLATFVLAVPTYQLARVAGRVGNGALHPALSSMFRVTDGLRMTMHQMLFVPVGEPTLSPDAPMNAAEILAYAERNHSFHSEHGVCAGPRAMIETFLAVLVDGATPPQSGSPGPAMRRALDDWEAAFDYAMHGLRAYAAVFAVWPAMTRAYETLAGLADGWAGVPSAAVDALRARLHGHLETLRASTFLATERWRVDREAVYADMYARCGNGLAGGAGTDLPLTAAVAGRRAPRAEAVDAALDRHLRTRLGSGDEATVIGLRECLIEFALQLQALIRVGVVEQAAINRLLGRPAPSVAFGARELDIHNLLQGADSRRLPFLIDEIRALLGISLEIDEHDIHVATLDTDGAAAGRPSPAPGGRWPAGSHPSDPTTTVRNAS
ncbi:MAG: hypothetical protein H6983_08800 [Ectothiorhodospiraceae bacterium]|nr:hypothetical protein [Ectothiorhodospiraceae bacterium]